MKNIVFIIFLLVINNAIAQPYIPFPTDSAQWSVRHTINSPFSQSTVQYKMKGDTLLNGIIYHKVYYSLDLAYSSSNQALHCFVREDTTKKVYVKYPFGSSMDTTEFVLYDFNLAIGDTFAIKLFNFTTDSILKFELTSRFSYPTLTDTSEDYQLQALAPSFWPCTVALGLEWISGVGAWLGPFYNEIPQNGCDSGSYEISCFWHRGNYVLGGTFCDYATGINEEANRTNILLYPNPANEEINIVFNDQSYGTGVVIISDMFGRLIERQSLKSGIPYNYNTESLPKSVYMVSLYIDGKLIENKKLVLIK